MSGKFESVVMYGSWLEVARSKLAEEDVCRLMVQLMEYGLSGKVPKNDNIIMDTIFEMARPNIDSNIRKKVGGRKGGRGNKKQVETIGLSNANVNGNANVNANDNANVNDAPSTRPSRPSKRANGSVSEKEPDWLRSSEDE